MRKIPNPLKIAGILASVLLVAASLWGTVGQYKVSEIKPNVFAWISDDVISEGGDPLFGRAGNAGFVITPKGVVVINSTNSPFNARDLLFEIRQRTSLPIRYVINTSGSPALTLGNETFADFKPEILSTPQAQASFDLYEKQLAARFNGNWRLQRDMRGVHPTPPTTTFKGKTTLQGLDMQIQVIDLGSNAWPGDAAVFLPQSGVVFLGDVFDNGYFPLIGRGDINHWIETLRQVESWNADAYIPAHGAPGTKTDLASFRQFLEWLKGAVESRIKKGESLEQIESELLPFRKYPWHATENEREALVAVYIQLAPKHPASTAKTAPNTSQSH